ncbi:RHS repeat-associated core domain-containing protein [Clostridium saccharobutylicum]|uniref:tRNA3(Ser)-specific nuclease WapA n=1 Tax=Clostridium saccharobutylicum TaxID=169679 RepID=A0A1S8N5I4_CLOSA|nr:RHS repeat-associated core domain-containing protein [Clostridium saccharobutylicum]OOM11707.1 tRNA3(Ser)-specific nuclease WapA precursor [Clostridium saccharobutylicum]
MDEQGSTVFITDKDQEIKNEYWYDAFGCILDSKEQVHNRITYTGQQFDGITGQYYLRARYYNPVIGRFTQEDTYRGDGLNLYAYCGNNPVGYYDPTGYSSTNNWHKFLSQNKGKKLSMKQMSEKYLDSGLKISKKSSVSNRLKYMGSTPSINSSVGKSVIEQMDEYGLIIKNGKGQAKKNSNH